MVVMECQAQYLKLETTESQSWSDKVGALPVIPELGRQR